MAADVDRLIRDPWRQVRAKVTGSPDQPLHAASFARHASKADMQAVGQFFRANPFGRLGAMITAKAPRPNGLSPLAIVAEVVKRRVAEIAKWTPFREAKVIFESSDRANQLIQAAFAEFQLQEDGRPIPVECYFMPKSARDPALEVSDFVMHAVWGQTRRSLAGRAGHGRDFKAVFHEVDRRLVSYMHITKVKSPLCPNL